MEGDFAEHDSPRSPLESLKLIRSTKEASIKSCSSDEADAALTNEGDIEELSIDFGDLCVINSHSVTLLDSSDEVHLASSFFEAPKWKHGLDHAAWCRKKTERQKKSQSAPKKDEPLEERDKEVLGQLQKTERKKAWDQWLTQKRKKEQMRREHNESETLKLKQKSEEQRSRDSRHKFVEWYNRKESERLNKQALQQTERQFRREASERKKKLSYNVKWDEWCQNKKHQALPTKFTHTDYPEPSWVNPNPWVVD